MSERLLTVELAPGGDAVEVHCNRNGLVEYIELLTRLAAQQAPEHVHLMTPNWAGSQLSAQKQNAEGILINKLTVFYWPD